jgi:hypothetical protein
MALLAYSRRRNHAVDISPDISAALQDRWPHHFEVTRRVTAVHESVFESSQVNCPLSFRLVANHILVRRSCPVF